MTKTDKRKSEEKSSYKPVKKKNEVGQAHQKILKSIGDRIEEIRIQKAISVSELCLKVKMSRTTYYRLINGMVYFNTEKLFKILDILETDITIDLNPKK